MNRVTPYVMAVVLQEELDNTYDGRYVGCLPVSDIISVILTY